MANFQEVCIPFFGRGEVWGWTAYGNILAQAQGAGPTPSQVLSQQCSVCQLVLLSKFTTRVLSSGPDGRTSPGFTPSSSAGGRRTVTGTTGRVGVRGIWGKGPGTSWPLIHQGRKDESSPKRCWARPFQGTVVSC